jgi:signal transduction histidine kinase
LAWQVAQLTGVVFGASALVGLRPHGAAFLGLFPAVSASALRLPARWSFVIAALAMGALGLAYGLGGTQPAYGIVLNEVGVVAFYAIALFARRMRESNENTQRLMAELEQTRAAQAQAAALAERQRLAREMHDVLAHTLSGLVLNLEGARLRAARDEGDPAVGEAIERAGQLAKTGLEEAKRAIGMLRDDALPGPDRLASLAEEFEATSGVACRLSVDGDERDLGSDGKLTLYRVAQEALTNIRKHARAERVDVHLSFEQAGTRLTIEDVEGAHDHRPPPGDGTGYGLTGMRERAELLGGTLHAGPTTDGFRVELWVPA